MVLFHKNDGCSCGCHKCGCCSMKNEGRNGSGNRPNGSR